MSRPLPLGFFVPLVVLVGLGQPGCRGDRTLARPVRVACVGDSVTFGSKIAQRRANCWPARLQNLLGRGYLVGNFGVPGATLLTKGYLPYTASQEFGEALAFNAGIVIIALGLNDNEPQAWPRNGGEFIADYIRLIGAFRGRPAEKKRIFICRMTPDFGGGLRAASGIPDWHDEIQGQIERVAGACSCPLIDLHEPLRSRPDLFPDTLHPNARGAAIIAGEVFDALRREGLVRR